MMYEDDNNIEVIPTTIDDIKDASLKLKFDILKGETDDEILVHKITIRGYKVVIKFERIKGTNLFRMSSNSDGVKKSFEKLYKALNK